MKNIYSFLIFIIVLYLYIYNNNNLKTNSLTSKILIFLGISSLNVINEIFNDIQSKTNIDSIKIIKNSFYIALIGMIAYIIFFDLVLLNNIFINNYIKSENLKILLMSIFICVIIFIYKNIHKKYL
jgi:hypothetical protein